MFKFIHAADLHLDSPLRGLSMLQDAPIETIRTATRKALMRLVDLCIEEQVAFLIIAGDVYDGDWEDYQTGLFFNRCMLRLRDHQIPVFLIRGNHDAQSQITRRLTLPDNVTEFPADAPATVKLPEWNVAIHGQSFGKRAVTENLALRYPPAEPWHFNIGVLHTCAEGEEDHEPYAPCSISDMVQKGYDYWALGHIHKRRVLHEHPLILFPGNLQGRHIREQGAKGCTLVTVDGVEVRAEHRDLDVLRWYECAVDLSLCEDDASFGPAVAEAIGALVDANRDQDLAIRVVLQGTTDLHGRMLKDQERYITEVHSAAYQAGGERVWIEKVRFRTRAREESGEISGSLGEILESVQRVQTDEAFLSDVLSHAEAIQTRMRDYFQLPEALRLEKPEDIAELLPDARDLVLSLLQKGGGNE